MKATELRIGNWVNYFGQRHMVRAVGNGNVTIGVEGYKSENVSINSISPIPLTEEWLARFGYRKIEDKANVLHYKLTMSSGKFLCIKPDGYMWIDGYGDDFIDIDIAIKHVHQLQNLYFALTGKELCSVDLSNVTSQTDSQEFQFQRKTMGMRKIYEDDGSFTWEYR